MIDLPPASVPALADLQSAVMDRDGKILRALDGLGPIAGRDVAVVDVPGTPWVERLRGAGTDPLVVAAPDGSAPLAVPAADASLDAVVTLWNGFRGVADAELAEADRVLRPGGRLLVVHDYGRDDISALRDPDAPEYRSWSRREGPFLRRAGFKIHVVHCFWSFETIDAAHEALARFGARGAAVAVGLKRPRLTWNVAVYHRVRGGEAAEPPPATEAAAPGTSPTG